MASNETDIAVLQQIVERLGRDLSTVESKVTHLEEMAGRWKGGFLALAALGGIAGWAASVWDKVTKPWH